MRSGHIYFLTVDLPPWAIPRTLLAEFVSYLVISDLYQPRVPKNVNYNEEL